MTVHEVLMTDTIYALASNDEQCVIRWYVRGSTLAEIQSAIATGALWGCPAYQWAHERLVRERWNASQGFPIDA